MENPILAKKKKKLNKAKYASHCFVYVQILHTYYFTY